LARSLRTPLKGLGSAFTSMNLPDLSSRFVQVPVIGFLTCERAFTALGWLCLSDEEVAGFLSKDVAGVRGPGMTWALRTAELSVVPPRTNLPDHGGKETNYDEEDTQTVIAAASDEKTKKN
jgi:hypothetical protein